MKNREQSCTKRKKILQCRECPHPWVSVCQGLLGKQVDNGQPTPALIHLYLILWILVISTEFEIYGDQQQSQSWKWREVCGQMAKLASFCRVGIIPGKSVKNPAVISAPHCQRPPPHSSLDFMAETKPKDLAGKFSAVKVFDGENSPGVIADRARDEADCSFQGALFQLPGKRRSKTSRKGRGSEVSWHREGNPSQYLFCHPACKQWTMPGHHGVQEQRWCWDLGVTIPKAVPSFMAPWFPVTPGYCTSYQLC